MLLDRKHDDVVELDGVWQKRDRTIFRCHILRHNARSQPRAVHVVGDGPRRIGFAGAIYDPEAIHLLRMYCSLYFHGHSVGGTNPSLLEAMADKAPVAAHDNPFNRAVLMDDAVYFSSAEEVLSIINIPLPPELEQRMLENNLARIDRQYNWPMIITEYDEFLTHCHTQNKA